MMKKARLILVCLIGGLFLMSAGLQDDTITKEDGVYVVNTTTICKGVEGYNGPVPVKVYIKKNKVERVEILRNQEGPNYLARVKKQLLHAWDGLTVKEASEKQVDAVTGATFTSEALVKNVQQGLEHFQKNKK